MTGQSVRLGPAAEGVETAPERVPGVPAGGLEGRPVERMIFHAGAIAVALLHLAFIVFVIAGGLLVLRWTQLAWIHLPAAIYGAAIEFGGWFCPLTRIENILLRKAGLAGYSDGFVSHYIFPLIYPSGLTRGVEVVIGMTVLIVNVGVYVRVFR